MRDKLKGKKSYMIAACVIALGAYGVWTGDISVKEGLTYLLGGGALASMRDALG